MADKQYLDYEGLGRVVANMSQTFSQIGHNHDDAYYTESEIDGKVSGLQADIDGKVAELQADIDGHSHSWSTVSDKPPYMIGKREVLYQGTHQFTEYSGGNLSTSTMYDVYEAIDEGSLSYYDLVEFVVDKYSIVCSIPEAPSIPLGGVEQGIEYMYHLGTIFVNGSLDLESGKSYNVSINRLPLYPELEMWLFDNGYVPYQTIAGSFASKSEMNTAMAKKADTTHTHAIADVTNLQTTLDSLQASIDSVDSAVDNIASGTVVVKEAEHAESADTATNAGHATSADTAASCTGNAATATSATKATQDGNGKNIASTYETKSDATAKLNTAKSYTDTEIAKLINASDDGVLNSITELADAIETNQDAIDALNAIADGKAAKDHTHTITAAASDDDVVVLTGTNGTNKVTYSASHANSGVTAGTYRSVTVDAKGHVTAGTNPTTLAGYGITDAAAKSHTHTVSQISDLTATAAELNLMDGVTATTAEINYLDGVTSGIQAQLDAKAASSALTSHTGNTTAHITSTERTNWNAAYTHSTAAHAPSNAEKNQNAFSNVKVGTATIAADTTTDTLTLVAGSNVTITPDATNDKITIAATDTKYTHPTSGVTAASYGDSTNQTPAHGGTFKVPYFTVNAAGHVTAASAHTVTLPTIESISDDAIDTIFANLNA